MNIKLNKNTKKFNTYMSCLDIEMTRRCDMQCKHCSKGKAQNLDISKEIIDKTLDEMENTYIAALGILGGEPFLKPDMIEYLINQIIKRHIYIDEVYIFTNGKHRIAALVEPFNNLINYLCDIESEIRPFIRWSNDTTNKRYTGTEHAKMSVIISDIKHNIQPNEVTETIDFYTSMVDNEVFSIVKQSDTYKSIGQLILEGNALLNYKDFLKSPVSLEGIRILNNNYHFVKESANLQSETFLKDMKFITKTLSISANGNIFPGSSMSYERVDKEYMFNILDCNNDFLKKVEAFCWQHPLNKKSMNIKNKFAAIEFCKAHNLDVEYMTDTAYQIVKNMNLIIDAYQQIAYDMHFMLPTLNFYEIDAIATATIILQMFERDIPKDFIDKYIDWCTEFDKDITPKWCRGFILYLTNIDKERRRS